MFVSGDCAKVYTDAHAHAVVSEPRCTLMRMRAVVSVPRCTLTNIKVYLGAASCMSKGAGSLGPHMRQMMVQPLFRNSCI
jgi:hypothetical protein